MTKNCCVVDEKHTQECIRESDSKKFKLPRKFSRKQCLEGTQKGFSVKSSCAPFRGCQSKKKKYQMLQSTHTNTNTNKHTHNKNSSAICVFHHNNNGVSGRIHFRQKNPRKSSNNNHPSIVISYVINGLSDGDHGFHIHEYGDLTDECTSACAHFNPDNTTHGGLKTPIRHRGDLGNITSKKGKSVGRLETDTISLDPTSPYSIIGRAVIVHEDPDDLGIPGDPESLKTGNSGRRLACGVIGLSKI